MQDEVDAIVAAWAEQRPELNCEPLELFSRLSRVAQLLADRRQQVFAAHGLAAHEFDVLAALRRSGLRQELRPGQLITSNHVTSGTMTNRLDRLVQRKLISRRADPEDGRQALVRLSAAGRRRIDAAFEALLATEHELFATLPARRRSEAINALRALQVALNQS
jgi:DNA-binding MarR family transcriptional regulator